MDGRHQKRRRNSFPADVPHRQQQLVRIDRQEIVVVAAHCARRPAKPMHLQRLQLRNLFGKELLLNLVRDGELVLQSLFFFLLFDQLLNRCRHRIERVSQRSQLVAGSHRNAMAEIASINVFGRGIELGNSLGHRSRQARADQQSQYLNHAENDCHEQQKELDRRGEVSQRRKQPLVKLGDTGLNADHCRVRCVSGFPVHHLNGGRKLYLAVPCPRRRRNCAGRVGRSQRLPGVQNI